jgi:hypothetical protein
LEKAGGKAGVMPAGIMADVKAITKGEADTDQARLVRQRAALDLVRSVKSRVQNSQVLMVCLDGLPLVC